MKKILIVVDYQKDFVTGSLGFPDSQSLEKPITDKINKYRALGYEVAFTFDTHHENYMHTREGRYLPVPHCIIGTEGWELYGQVGKNFKPEDKVFLKSTFGSGELFDFLRGSGYNSVELVGVVTDICVISNAVLARTALPEADIIVDAACTSAADPEKLNAAFSVLKSIHTIILNR